MAGLGSGGRSRTGGKPTTDDHHSLDVRELHRDGALSLGGWVAKLWPHRHGAAAILVKGFPDSGYVLLKYGHGAGTTAKSTEYPVRLDWTPCTLGGRRPWFRCPACNRRTAILYSGSVFQCRKCLGL
ncbi:MAG: hypothetical protein ACRDD1_05480, partial [Planctomycetia bacterium]